MCGVFVLCFAEVSPRGLSPPRCFFKDRFPKKTYIPPRGELRGYHGKSLSFSKYGMLHDENVGTFKSQERCSRTPVDVESLGELFHPPRYKYFNRPLPPPPPIEHCDHWFMGVAENTARINTVTMKKRVGENTTRVFTILK